MLLKNLVNYIVFLVMFPFFLFRVKTLAKPMQSTADQSKQKPAGKTNRRAKFATTTAPPVKQITTATPQKQ